MTGNFEVEIWKTQSSKSYNAILNQARRNEKNSGGGAWEFIKKCWPTWLADEEDRSIEFV